MATIREKIKVKKSLTLFLLNQFKLCSIVNFSLEVKDLSPPLDLKSQSRKRERKRKTFSEHDLGIYVHDICQSVTRYSLRIRKNFYCSR